MRNSAAFLNDEEKQEYQELDGGIQRSVIEIPNSPVALDARQKIKPESRPLAPHIVAQVRGLIAKLEREGSASIKRKWFGCSCVEVKEDDGMTWSAETVSLALKGSFPHFNGVYLASYKDSHSLPAISNLIGVRRFLKIAGQHKMGTLSVFSNRWPAPAIVVAAILIGIVLKVFETPQGGSPTKMTYLTVVASAALGLVLQYVITHLTDRTTPKKIEKFNSELEKILREEDQQKYGRFIDSLASYLQSLEFPRFVIIDDYERLDLTTKSVIQRYFEKNVADADGSEYWVVFEGQDGDKFSTRIADGPQFEGYRDSRILQQLFLDEEQRHSLVERFDRPPETVNYQAIKLICKDTAKGKERVKKIVERYRREHPREAMFGNLEFLYLLSLTAASPSNFFLSDPDLINRLVDSSSVRAQVLRQFLHGTKLGLNEFRNRLKSAAESFPTFLIVEDTRVQKNLRVIPETPFALAETAKALDLPHPGLGHLFWSLYWYNKLEPQKSPPEAFWMRKLNHHIKEAALITPAGDEIDKRILSELFDALIYAVKGSLRTGVFEDVTPLLEKAPYLLEMGELTGSYSHQKRLAKLCWEAYSVLGRDEILGVIFDLYALPGRQAQTETKEETEDLLETLFFESMPLFPARRATLKTDFFHSTVGERQTVESVSHYARVRSAWLALSVSPIVGLDVTKLHQTVQRSDETLEDLTRKALERISSESEESVRITDIATLSLALWCNALRFHPAVAYMTQSDHAANFKALVDLATEAVLKASYIREEATIRSEHFLRMDFLASGLAGELYAVALASIITAYQYLVRQGQEVIDQPLLKQINDLFKFSDEIFNYPLPSALTRQHLTSSELVKKVDAMLKFCSIIWNRFGLQLLLEFTNIRRVHFNAICLGVNYAREESYESLLESVGVAINDKGFTGLITNLVIADCLRQAGEIEAYYLRQAGVIAVEGDFGLQLQQELSFAVVNEIHNLGYDLDIFLENILEENGHKECFLLSLLDRLPPSFATGRVLSLINAPKPHTPPEISGRLEEVIASYVQRIELPEVKREVDSLLQYFSIEGKIHREEPLDVPAILASWSELKDLPAYAGVLNLIIENYSAPPDVLRESLSVLDHDPAQDNYAWHLFLAMKRARHFVTTDENDADVNAILVRYLRPGIEKWKSSLTAEINVTIYRILRYLDPEKRTYYFSELQNWEYVKVRRNQLERLPQLVAEGRFFLIFSDYTFTMLPWGLASDVELKAFSGHLNVPPEQKKERLIEWKNNDGEVPRPLINEDSVSSEFIYLGQYLFSAPNDQDPLFHDARNVFNQAAYDAMPELLDLITGLPALPNSIKELLQNYSKRFFYDPAGPSND